VVYNLTRFAREKHDHFALRAYLRGLGISLRSVTEPIDDTSTGKLMEGVLASFAQFDNDIRSERTRAGMRAALERGRWTFVAPLGYLNGAKCASGSLVPDPERAPIIQQAFEDFATGHYTKQESWRVSRRPVFGVDRATWSSLRPSRTCSATPPTSGESRSAEECKCAATSSRSSMKRRSTEFRPSSTGEWWSPDPGLGTIQISR
jgi:resolvase-like protein